MKKTDLINTVVEKTGLTKKDCAAVCNEFVEAIAQGLADGEKISLLGFGTFEVRARAGREGRNPSTGEKIQIKASKNPAFKPSKALKERVNK